MPLTEPGVRLSIRTGLPGDVDAPLAARVDTASLLESRGVTADRSSLTPATEYGAHPYLSDWSSFVIGRGRQSGVDGEGPHIQLS